MPALDASADLGNPRLQRHRQLQLVEPEHGQRQRNEYRGKAAKHPGILQHGCKHRA